MALRLLTASAIATMSLGCNALLGNESGIADTDAGSITADAALEGSAGNTESGAPTAPTAGEGFDLVVRFSGLSHVGAQSQRDLRLWRGGIAVADSNLYWLESGDAPALKWGNKADGSATSSISLVRPGALRSTKVIGGGYVWLANAATVQRLDWGSSTLNLVATGKDDITNLVSDGQDSFWTFAADGVIHRRNQLDVISDLAIGQATTVSLTIGGSNLYWLALNGESSGVLRAIKSDGSEPTPRTLAALSETPRIVGASANYIYYGVKSQMRRRLTDATATVDVVAGDALDPWDIVVNEVYAYWIEQGDPMVEGSGRLRRIAHADNQAVTLATGLSAPVGLTVDGTTVYVALAGTSKADYRDGSILRITPKN